MSNTMRISQMVSRLTIDESMLALPVTDLRHVLNEINLLRRARFVLDCQRKYQRACNARWQEKKKLNDHYKYSNK